MFWVDHQKKPAKKVPGHYERQKLSKCKLKTREESVASQNSQGGEPPRKKGYKPNFLTSLGGELRENSGKTRNIPRNLGRVLKAPNKRGPTGGSPGGAL